MFAFFFFTVIREILCWNNYIIKVNWSWFWSCRLENINLIVKATYRRTIKEKKYTSVYEMIYDPIELRTNIPEFPKRVSKHPVDIVSIGFKYLFIFWFREVLLFLRLSAPQPFQSLWGNLGNTLWLSHCNCICPLLYENFVANPEFQ